MLIFSNKYLKPKIYKLVPCLNIHKYYIANEARELLTMNNVSTSLILSYFQAPVLSTFTLCFIGWEASTQLVRRFV